MGLAEIARELAHLDRVDHEIEELSARIATAEQALADARRQLPGALKRMEQEVAEADLLEGPHVIAFLSRLLPGHGRRISKERAQAIEATAEVVELQDAVNAATRRLVGLRRELPGETADSRRVLLDAKRRLLEEGGADLATVLDVEHAIEKQRAGQAAAHRMAEQLNEAQALASAALRGSLDPLPQAVLDGLVLGGPLGYFTSEGKYDEETVRRSTMFELRHRFRMMGFSELASMVPISNISPDLEWADTHADLAGLLMPRTAFRVDEVLSLAAYQQMSGPLERLAELVNDLPKMAARCRAQADAHAQSIRILAAKRDRLLAAM